ncbi:MAG: 1-deoxy-D-xylulose-5-phosphate synthase, partial [Lachnospiraceae bacterium]|nr:1-deoxy-D-xylulose-5-phosphate synthase [Lachnospiraceae bacterium]
VRGVLKEKGYPVSLINARFAKPIDTETVEEICKNHSLIVTLEENVASGGYGEKVRDYVFDNKLDCDVLIIALPDDYVEHGNVDILKQEVGIDTDSIVTKVITRYLSWGNKNRKDTGV